MQVLIVDDDMATVDVIKNSVKWKELGVSDIFTAYNIQLAKEILKEHNIDIVIWNRFAGVVSERRASGRFSAFDLS